jgi:putative phosphoribosyl transferase
MERAQRSDAERLVEVKVGQVLLPGIFGLPGPRGVVVFAHRSGNGRLNPRNAMVARMLQEGGLATFRVDLLLPDEAQVLHNIFDIRLLADRLLAATEWVMQQQETKGLRIGYMSTSNGTAAALQAAARLPEAIGAVVSRGGRPDLARTFLPNVKAPTLLLVGENDPAATEQNQKAYQQLGCPKEMIIVPGASHLFEEPGTFDQVAVHARAWFLRYLVQESA